MSGTKAFQPGAFQNPTLGQHSGFEVQTPDAVGPDGVVTSLQVDQSSQFVADQFEIQYQGDQYFFQRSKVSSATLRTGLLNDFDVPDLVTHIDAGTIDEWELVFTPNGTAGILRGRDASAIALDKALQITYSTGNKQPP